MPKVQKEDIKI